MQLQFPTDSKMWFVIWKLFSFIFFLINPYKKYENYLKSNYHLLYQFPEMISVNIVLYFLPDKHTYACFIPLRYTEYIICVSYFYLLF